MFERFTSHARRVLALAQEEARFLGHDYAGSEHLLLGLIRDQGSAGDALRRQGIQLDAARRAVASFRGRSAVKRVTVGDGSLPFSMNAKAAVQAAVNDAQASQGAVDSNHLLFGVLRDQSPTVQAVLHQLRSGQSAPAPSPAPAAAQATQASQAAPVVAAATAPPASPADAATLEARVDELTTRVDRLQALVNELSQRASVRDS